MHTAHATAPRHLHRYARTIVFFALALFTDGVFLASYLVMEDCGEFVTTVIEQDKRFPTVLFGCFQIQTIWWRAAYVAGCVSFCLIAILWLVF